VASVPEVCVRPQRVAASPPATGTLPVVDDRFHLPLLESGHAQKISDLCVRGPLHPRGALPEQLRELVRCQQSGRNIPGSRGICQ
jgi:hypothetical protein